MKKLYDVVMTTKKELQETKLQLKEQIETKHKQEHIAGLEKITNSHDQLFWRIDDYQRKFRAARSGEVDAIFSPEFYTSKRFWYILVHNTVTTIVIISSA